MERHSDDRCPAGAGLYLRDPAAASDFNEDKKHALDREGKAAEQATRGLQPYPIADAIVKIGRYIAMTMNPITVPRTTIMIGSNRDVIAATA